MISWKRIGQGRRHIRASLAAVFSGPRAFLALSPDERSLFLQAAWRLPLVALQLRRFGLQPFQRTRGCAPHRAGPPPEPAECILRAQRTRHFVELASRHGVCRGNCLSRSVTLWYLLRQQGIDTDLRVGVTRATDGIEAHAWIEFQGIILNDQPDVHRRFQPFDRPLLSG